MCYYVKSVCCFVHTMSYYVKSHVVMINVRVIMTTQCLIMLKGYGVMLNSRAVLFTRSFIMLMAMLLC